MTRLARTSFWTLLAGAALVQSCLAAGAIFGLLHTLACYWAVLPFPSPALCLAVYWPAAIIPWAIVGALTLASALLTGHTALQSWATWRRTRRALDQLTTRRSAPGGRLQRLTVSHHLPVPTLLAHPQPIALCHGLVRPRVLVSTGLLDVLDDDQLLAVLAHEAAHARQRDPLRRLVLRALSLSGATMPALDTLADHARLTSEWHADRAAIATTDIATLAGALHAVATGATTARPVVLDTPAFCAIKDRVRYLTSTDTPPLVIPRWRVAVSAAAATLVFGLPVWMLYVASHAGQVVEFTV